MMCPCSHRRGSRGTFGEALITVAALAGFFYGLAQGAFSLRALWSYALVLLVVVMFYASLLICRMVFYWATGGDHVCGPDCQMHGNWAPVRSEPMMAKKK